MLKELKFIFILLLLTLGVESAHAGKRYWIASTASTWNTTANWSASSGGAGGASVPSSNDTAFFDANGTANDTINATVNIKRLDVASGYTGKIVQGSNTITIGSTGATLAGGIFSGGSGNITVSGTFIISGTAFTSTSGTFSTSANFTFSGGSFTHNNGLMKFTATNTITGSITFYQLEFAPAATSNYSIAVGTVLTVNNTLTISGGSNQANINTGAIHAKGNITITNTSTASFPTATVTINGTVKQTITGTGAVGQGKLPNVVINKTDTLVLVDTISVNGNWTWTAGVVNAGTSTVHFANTLTITGSHELFNVNFSGTAARTFTIATGTTLTVKGKLATTGTFDVILNGGTINAKGNITIDNTSTTGTGTTTITINGTTNQTFTGTGGMGEGKVPNIIINKSSGTLTLANIISVYGNWTWTAGRINAGTSTVHFANTLTITGSDTLYNVNFSGGVARTFTITPGTTLTIMGTMSVIGGSDVTLITGTINVKGDIMDTNMGLSAAGSTSIIVNGTGTQSIMGSGTAGAGRLPKITIDKPSGDVSLHGLISVYGDWIYLRGNVRAGLSTVALYGNADLDGQPTVSGDSLMSFYTLSIADNTRTLTGNVDVNNNLSIGSGATLSAGSDTVYVGGSWSNAGGTFTYGTSTVIFDGTTYRQIRRTGGADETFYNLGFNRDTASQTLSIPVIVNNNLKLTKGHVKTTTTNYLLLIDNATLTGGSDSAYVHGPVRKTGNDAFVFPLGDTTLVDTAYHPLAMSAPSSTGDQFEATYFAHVQTVGDSLVDSLSSVSQEEYWIFERKAGSSNVTVSISWNKNSDIGDIGSLRVAAWNGTKWLDFGQSSVSVSWPRGTVTSSVAMNFPSNPIVIVHGVSKCRYCAYATLQRKLDGGFYESKAHSLYFKFDDEYNDQLQHLTYKVINSTNVDQAPGLVSNTNNSALSYYGDNRFRLDLYTNSGPLAAGYYILEIINEKNEKFYLRFKIS